MVGGKRVYMTAPAHRVNVGGTRDLLRDLARPLFKWAGLRRPNSLPSLLQVSVDIAGHHGLGRCWLNHGVSSKGRNVALTTMANGTLFTEDFLAEGIDLSAPWRELEDAAVAEAREALAGVFGAVRDPERLNEAQTEERIVRPILQKLGWGGAFSVQTNIERHRRANVADYTLFASPEAFARADLERHHDGKLKHAVAVADAKAWAIELDQVGGGAGRGETPAQILRYLTRAEAVSDRAVRFAILTNGRRWRLYFSGARSLLDDTFEIDLAWALGLPGTQGTLDASGKNDADRIVKTFLLVFRRQAFLPSAALEGRTFHDFARDEGRLWETKVRQDLARVVFSDVFPGLVRSLASVDPSSARPYAPTYLKEVGDVALTLLYRLLFALYAEDRDLLPPQDPRYDDYALSALRDRVAHHVDAGGALSTTRAPLFRHAADLFRIIDEGDTELGIPPYNGRLFAAARAPLLDRAPLPDAAFAPLFDRLSRTDKGGRRVRINFRDLSVRELGAIYEGLLVYEPAPDEDAEGGIAIRLNPFGRKGSGSYYTPDELVKLLIVRTLGPLVSERIGAFVEKAEDLARDRRPIDQRLTELTELDPASRILDLKVCDPAMGSGHFLVALVDYLAERVFTATSAAAATVTWAPAGYVSPLLGRLAAIRQRIESEAAQHGWAIQSAQLTDQNLVKRVVLKRCVYGVDKNPMAVELAKLALWLNTFTAGAPLSFLDHHLRCGDSLFGERVRGTLDDLKARGGLLINAAIQRAEGAVAGMARVEELTDAEIAEVRASMSAFAEVENGTAPLTHFLDVWQALKWLDLASEEKRALGALLDGAFGDPVRVVSGLDEPKLPGSNGGARDLPVLTVLLERARDLATRERFLHWQPAFPGVWRDWASGAPTGGFDAVIGNPPWDRMKMQEVEWFADRAPAIARQARAADRKRMVAALKRDDPALASDHGLAQARAERAMDLARVGGEYPLLSRGDINIYSLFVERAQALIKPDGIAGLLTPSGIASDLGASLFFKGVATAGRVLALFDFENRRGDGREAFFPDVDSRFKFCAFVVGGARRTAPKTDCGFFLRDDPSASSPDQLFSMSAADFALVNPNTGTAPIFRSSRDAALITAIYRRLPVLVDRSRRPERRAWPVRYLRMFDMTNDSGLFWTRALLDKAGAYRVEAGRWRRGAEEWVPLYEGKMVQAFDHRAADVKVNAANLHRPAQPEPLTAADKANPARLAAPQYWVASADRDRFSLGQWALGFKEITSPTNERGMIAAIVPAAGYGNTLPIVSPERGTGVVEVASWCATWNSFVFDFVARSKIQGQHLNWFIVEQLPIVSPENFDRRFGPLSAAEIVRDHVLRLSYTAHDLEPFAVDLGHVDAGGFALPPFSWDEAARRQLRARLDALFLHLYGLADEDDVAHVMSTFPIVQRKDEAAFGCYLTRELILWHHRALAAGDAARDAPEAELIRAACESRR